MNIVMNRAQRRAERKGRKGAQDLALQKVAGSCALFAQLAMCRGYGAGPIIGDTTNIHQSAENTLSRSIVNVRAALQRLMDGVATEIDDPLIVSEALGVASIRAIDIGGPDVGENPLLHALQDGQRVLQSVKTRHERFGKLEVISSEAERLKYAVDLYVDVIQNSTPQQMEDAMKTRLRMRDMARAGKLVS